MDLSSRCVRIAAIVGIATSAIFGGAGAALASDQNNPTGQHETTHTPEPPPTHGSPEGLPEGLPEVDPLPPLSQPVLSVLRDGTICLAGIARGIPAVSIPQCYLYVIGVGRLGVFPGPVE